MPMSSIYPQSGFRQPTGYQSQPIPGMSLNMPLGVLQPPQPTEGIIGLHGLDSAKQYPTKPNMTIPTFDMDSDHAFIINTDANNVPSIKILKCSIVSEEEYRKATEADKPVQIPKSEYEKLLKRIDALEEELDNAKQPVRKRNTKSNSTRSTTAELSDESSDASDAPDV
jgi:hypothetical protein